MKVIKIIPTQIEVYAIKVVLPVEFEDEDIPADFPMRIGDVWEAIIDIETGKIRLWPQGESGRLSMKVTDGGEYYLLSPAGEEVGSIVNNYVPKCIPGEYGDYVDFDINVDGSILNWKKFCTESNIVSSFDLQKWPRP